MAEPRVGPGEAWSAADRAWCPVSNPVAWAALAEVGAAAWRQRQARILRRELDDLIGSLPWPLRLAFAVLRGIETLRHELRRFVGRRGGMDA